MKLQTRNCGQGAHTFGNPVPIDEWKKNLNQKKNVIGASLTFDSLHESIMHYAKHIQECVNCDVLEFTEESTLCCDVETNHDKCSPDLALEKYSYDRNYDAKLLDYFASTKGFSREELAIIFCKECKNIVDLIREKQKNILLAP